MNRKKLIAALDLKQWRKHLTKKKLHSLFKRDKLIITLPLLASFILVLVLVAIVKSCSFKDDNAKYAHHLGEPVAVTDLAFLGDTDARFTTASWRGRPYVVNFFASWCADCRAEHEELMTLAGSDIPLVGISFHDRDDKVTGYLDRYGNPFIAVAGDEAGHAAKAWGIHGVPETFVIDRRGIVRWHHAGPITDQIASEELMPLWENLAHGEPR